MLQGRSNRFDHSKARGQAARCYKTACYLRRSCGATIKRVPLFFLAHARAPIFTPCRAAYSPISMRYFLATNGSDSTYLDPVRPREPGALRYVYEYATIKRDLFISMTPEIDPSRALIVEMQDLVVIGKGLYLAETKPSKILSLFFFLL